MNSYLDFYTRKSCLEDADILVDYSKRGSWSLQIVLSWRMEGIRDEFVGVVGVTRCRTMVRGHVGDLRKAVRPEALWRQRSNSSRPDRQPLTRWQQAKMRESGHLVNVVL